MSIVRLEALRCLAKQIEAFVPELVGNTRVLQVPPEQALQMPELVVLGSSFKLSHDTQESEQSQPTNSTLCAQVATWDVTVQLRLAHATPGQQKELEEKIVQAFFQRPGAPGVLVSQVVTSTDVGPFFASWDLDDSSWDTEMAFSSQWWTTCTLTGQVPALAIRQGVYSLNELQFGLTRDFSVPATSTGFATISNLVDVNADGTVTPVS